MIEFDGRYHRGDFEARGQYLRAIAEFHTVIPEIERLIAQEIHTVQP